MEVKTANSYEEILALANEAGIKSSRLEDANETSNVPEEGEIEVVEVVENGKMSHIRVKFNDGSRCSVSRLRGQAFFGEKDKAEFSPGVKPETKDFVFLKTQILNSNIPANQARIIELVGKKFKSEKVVGFVVPLKTDDAENPIFHKTAKTAKAEMTAKDFWKITIL